MTDRTESPRRNAGFTLLELLVVIGIIGLLVVAFAPAIGGALGRGDVTKTVDRQLELVAMIDAYKRYFGEYPPDDMSTYRDGPQADWQLGNDNGKNTGIESLVMHLSWDPKSGGRLAEHEDWFANTDGDKAAVEIPLLSRRDKVEVVDAWGTPFAYFTGRTGSGYNGQQAIVGPLVDGQGDELIAKPWKNPATGKPLNERGCQLISAGPDMVFNTEDDIVYPELPKD